MLQGAPIRMRNLRDTNQFIKLYLRSMLDFSFESKVLLTSDFSWKNEYHKLCGKQRKQWTPSALVLLSKYLGFFLYLHKTQDRSWSSLPTYYLLVFCSKAPRTLLGYDLISSMCLCALTPLLLPASSLTGGILNQMGPWHSHQRAKRFPTQALNTGCALCLEVSSLILCLANSTHPSNLSVRSSRMPLSPSLPV